MELLVVAGIVIGIFIWNPGNIFGNGLKLQSTANHVSSIKQIGQLVTAEYYGEVIATYDQSILQLVAEEDVGEQADEIFVEMKEYLLSKHLEAIARNAKENVVLVEAVREKKQGFWARLFGRNSKSKRKFKKEVKKEWDTIEVDSIFFNDDLAGEILGFYFDKSVPDAKSNKYANLLWSLFVEVKTKNDQLDDAAFNEYLRQGLDIVGGKSFSDFHYDRKSKTDKRKKELKNTSLAMIGRGWVKAGIDFGELNEQNFVFEEELGVVHLYGIYPRILDKDINPWFIPERKIPGFQILESKNANFNDAVMVKKRCIDKLEAMARKAGIIKQAEKQCKETLKNFIGLVTGKEVREVHFHNDVLTLHTREIIRDQVITFEEGVFMDSLILATAKEINEIFTSGQGWSKNEKRRGQKTQRLGVTIGTLKKVYYDRLFKVCDSPEGVNKYYNPFSQQTANIVADSIFTIEETNFLEEAARARLKVTETIFDIKDKGELLVLKTWYPDSPLNYVRDFNNMLCTIRHTTKYMGAKTYDTIISIEQEEAFKENPNHNFILLEAYETRLRYRVIEDVLDVDSVISKLRYPMNLPKDWKHSLSRDDNGKSYFRKAHIKNDTLTLDATSFLKKYNSFQDVENRVMCDTLVLIRNEDQRWAFEPTQCKISNPEQKQLLEHLFNHFLEEDGPGWFSRTSAGLKGWLAQD